MAKTRVEQPRVRKSVLVFGGVAVAVAVLGFVFMSFFGGGSGGGDVPAPSAQAPASQPSVTDDTPQAPARPAGLRPGGRDPFRPVVNVAPAAAPS